MVFLRQNRYIIRMTLAVEVVDGGRIVVEEVILTRVIFLHIQSSTKSMGVFETIKE
jgi:hypothetical protein